MANFATVFSRLRASLARPQARRLLRVGGGIALAIYFLLMVLVLVLRYSVLPRIGEYRADIERSISQAAGLPVSIRQIDARWQGLHPQLAIHGLEIRDTQGRPALSFDDVEADVAWSSLWHFGLRLARLEIAAPALDVRRDAAGRVFVAGLQVDTESQDRGFSEWLLAQDRIVVRDAVVTWHDELRAAPPLWLSHLNIELQNSGAHHRFGLTADPPRPLAARLDLRGDFAGDDFADLSTWQGEAYAELDYADLAGWHAWVDYPVDLPRGSGGLRLWLGLAGKEVQSVTADLRLFGVQMRLAPDLPMLELERLDGRLAGKRGDDEFEFHAKRLALATRDGIRIDPMDVDLRLDKRGGTADASGLDLSAVAALAGYLPLGPELRAKLDGYAPRGLLRQLKLSWRGKGPVPEGYSLEAGFENLGLNPVGMVPGFAGLNGTVKGDQTGGRLELNCRHGAVELPEVFAEPHVDLTSLDARLRWQMSDGTADVNIERIAFENADAAGEASGRYRGDGRSAGQIDLNGRLTRAAANAVWRYMPLVAGKDARDWLKQSLAAGAASASLRLKGDLSRFPFADGSGVFEVKGPFQGGVLNYAPGWPGFRDVAGELEFVGPRMIIRARQGHLWDVTMTGVTAEVPDLGADEPLMSIAGAARGPTADFLRFIETSPVGDRIDHFTADMRATGEGELKLGLSMPLTHVQDTKVDGRYRFLGDVVAYDPDLPSLADVNGDLHFTADSLEARSVRGNLLGGPVLVDVATAADGGVAVKAAGTVGLRGLRQQYGLPLFDHLSGSAALTASVRVRKQSAEVRVESSLVGVSSSLPEPFNKSAGEAMPLVFERKPFVETLPRGRRSDGIARDQLAVTLGSALRAQLVRRHDGGKNTTERGLIAVNRPELRLPERGVLLAAQARRVDADLWKRLATGAGGNGGAPVPVSAVDLRADQLLAFGRPVNGLRLVGSLEGGVWKADMKSREASGHLEWSGEGAGRLSGRLSQLAIPDEEGAGADPGSGGGDMPAIDLAVDHLLLKGKDFGELKLAAENKGGAWNARFALKNEDAGIEGNGRWQAGSGVPETRLDFTLNAKNVGKTLVRLGHPDAVKDGSAVLSGNLAWVGSPRDFDVASLSGQLKLEARNGQFKKLEPGAGRLLGILSLQSVLRRITFDFKDIFGEGFAFDSIRGQASVARGVLETNDFTVAAPSAKVQMAGTVDLGKETEDLKVRVQPAVGETVATGALLVHPAVGAGVWLFNKMFGTPLDKALAFDYAVTGSWSDPKVEKLAVTAPAGKAEAK